MNKLKMKAKAGVTLVELLVVMLIATILVIGLLPLFKPFIEQAKYSADVQPVIGTIQTKINLYQYEKDQLPCANVTTDPTTGVKTETPQDDVAYGWMIDPASAGKARTFQKAEITGLSSGSATYKAYTGTTHLSNFVDVDWQDLTGKRMNPSQFQYHLIKGLGAATYGYAIGVFGDGEGLAKGTGYAILVLVNTEAKIKIIATWERYKPVSDEVVCFKTVAGSEIAEDKCCRIPTAALIEGAKNSTDWQPILEFLKANNWSFNFDEVK